MPGNSKNLYSKLAGYVLALVACIKDAIENRDEFDLRELCETLENDALPTLKQTDKQLRTMSEHLESDLKAMDGLNNLLIIEQFVMDLDEVIDWLYKQAEFEYQRLEGYLTDALESLTRAVTVLSKAEKKKMYEECRSLAANMELTEASVYGMNGGNRPSVSQYVRIIARQLQETDEIETLEMVEKWVREIPYRYKSVKRIMNFVRKCQSEY